MSLSARSKTTTGRWILANFDLFLQTGIMLMCNGNSNTCSVNEWKWLCTTVEIFVLQSWNRIIILSSSRDYKESPKEYFILLISHICSFGWVPRLLIFVYVLYFDLDWISDIWLLFLCAEFRHLDSAIFLCISWEFLFSLQSSALFLYLTINWSDKLSSRRNCSFCLIMWNEESCLAFAIWDSCLDKRYLCLTDLEKYFC